MNHEQHNTPSLAHSPLESRSNAPALSPSAVMYWDGGERAITAREKATIEEHSPSSFSIALVPAGSSDAWTNDARSYGNALNEAAWLFVDQCPEKSALLFNSAKVVLRSAILRYAELVGVVPPAQGIDLLYSLDADTAGIRARVADVVTGTLMVGAQGHTPPPAGHWAEPFWQMARADASAQGILLEKLRALVEQWKELPYPFSYEGQCAQRAADSCREDLLALIDSERAAAPGVDRG